MVKLFLPKNMRGPVAKHNASSDDEADPGSTELAVLLPSRNGDTEQTESSVMARALFSIKGMHCSSCSAAVEAALRGMLGVQAASVRCGRPATGCVQDLCAAHCCVKRGTAIS